MNDFNWNDIDPEAIVVEQASETAVYWTPKGDLVLRQRGDEHDEDDTILIPRHYVETLVSRIQAMLLNRPPK